MLGDVDHSRLRVRLTKSSKPSAPINHGLTAPPPPPPPLLVAGGGLTVAGGEKIGRRTETSSSGYGYEAELFGAPCPYFTADVGHRLGLRGCKSRISGNATLLQKSASFDHSVHDADRQRATHCERKNGTAEGGMRPRQGGAICWRFKAASGIPPVPTGCHPRGE